METAVVSEIVRSLTHRGVNPQVYFWRTSAGTEVDFVVEAESKLVPIEVKLSATPRPAMASPIKNFQQDFAGRVLTGYVVQPGDVRLPLGEGVSALPFVQLQILNHQAVPRQDPGGRCDHRGNHVTA
jgi:hypothetical protein